MTPQKFVAYYRVSTKQQGLSGLGLEAQEASVLRHLAPGDELLASFTDVGSGTRKGNKRPELPKALAACRREKAVLLIAKLDRLARNVAFVSNLMESRVEFLAVEGRGPTDGRRGRPACAHSDEGWPAPDRAQDPAQSPEHPAAGGNRGAASGAGHQDEERRALGDAYCDEDFVFAGPYGASVSERNLVQVYFKPTLAAAGLPASICLYDLEWGSTTSFRCAIGHQEPQSTYC